MKSIFVAGISTDVGKTMVSAALCASFGYEYFKPIQSGEPCDKDRVASLLNGVGKTHKNAISLDLPISPHLAARAKGIDISLSSLSLPKKDRLLIELAGGLYTPISQNLFMIDIISHFKLPVFLVAREYLGAINHSFLSLQALKSRGLELLGVIISGNDSYLGEILKQNLVPCFNLAHFKDEVSFKMAAKSLAKDIRASGVLS